MTWTSCGCDLQIGNGFCEFLSLSFKASPNIIVGVVRFIRRETVGSCDTVVERMKRLLNVE
jgi:hypothetical protein